MIDLVPSGARLYPAGRLDAASEGLVLLTNDGDLTRHITAAGNVQKVYRVKVRGCLSKDEMAKLTTGFQVEGEWMGVVRIDPLKRGANCWYEVVLMRGRNRQIRRMLEALGHPVMRLKRTQIGSLKLGGLKPGEWRKLKAREVKALKDG